MSLLLDSFWRAVAYCMHPRVIALSFLPLVVMVALALGLGYLFWQDTIDWVYAFLDGSNLLSPLWSWLQGMGAGNLKAVVAPLVVIFAVTPVIVLLSLIVVATAMTPAMVALVAERRFPALERKKGGSFLMSLVWSLGSMLLAVIALIISLPLWLVPPLILAAAADLGLADLPCAGLRLAGRSRQPRGAPRNFPPASALAAGHRHPDGLPGRGARRGVGLGRPVRGGLCGAGAGGDLDLHAGVCVFLAVVCPLCAGRAGKTSGRVGFRGGASAAAARAASIGP